MEIINIESRTYEAMMQRFEAFVGRVDALCQRHGKKDVENWLDNQDVCEILGISKRTLQTYRKKGLLPFSIIRHKIFYKSEDVENLLKMSHHPNTSTP